MPVTSESFTLEHSNPNLTGKLNMALDYLQSSPVGAVILELAAASGMRIGMNPYGADNYPDLANPGGVRYDAESHLTIWNPDSALQIMTNDHTIIGVQSAALGLLHEMVHAIDPAVLSHLDELLPGTGYRNLTEYTAIQYESLVAGELGEVARDNWRGKGIVSENPTTHTMPTEDGGLIWTQTNEYGVDEYGPAYASPGQEPEQRCPEFGSTAEGNNEVGNPNDQGWPDDIPARDGNPDADQPSGDDSDPGNEHDYDPGNYPGNEHDNDPGNYPGNEHDFDPEWTNDPLKTKPKPDEHQTTHHNDHGVDAAQLVGVPPPPQVDSIGFM